MHDDSGPYVLGAFLCEKVLQEADGVLSFIRCVDRFGRPKPSAEIPPQMSVIQVNLVVILRNGGLPTGNYRIAISVFKPEESEPSSTMEHRPFIEGGADKGVNIVTPMVIVPDRDGLYWIDVQFEERIMTRVPFRVIHMAPPSIQQGTAG